MCSLKKLTVYELDTLNRQCLHFMHCKRCLNGQLMYHLAVVCDANSTKEWNPYYRIVGRSEKQQDESHRAKWGDHWFQEASSKKLHRAYNLRGNGQSYSIVACK